MALLGSHALRGQRLWVQVRQQHNAVVPPLYLKRGEIPVSQSSWEHTPETLRRCLSPSPSRRVTSLPEGQPRKGIFLKPLC